VMRLLALLLPLSCCLPPSTTRHASPAPAYVYAVRVECEWVGSVRMIVIVNRS